MGALAEELEELKTPGASRAQAIAERGALLARQAGLRAEALVVEADQQMHAAVPSVVEDVDASVVVVGSRRLGAIQSMALLGSSGRAPLAPPGPGRLSARSVILRTQFW